jgi:putative transcriptional regulator
MIRIRLGKLLKQRDWSAYKLSQQSGIHPNVLSKYRHNQVKEISLETLNSLCKALRCKAGDLIEYLPDRKRD